MSSTQTPDRIEREQIEGRKAKAYIYHSDTDYASRIEVEREARWVFGVDEAGVATLVETTTVADDLAAEPELPEWLVDSLHGFSIEEIEA